MEIILWSIGIFVVIIGLIPALITVLRDNDLSELLPVYRPHKKKVGASYWGYYTDEAGVPEKPDESIALPKITPEGVATAYGSNVYVKGKPVKSLRR